MAPNKQDKRVRKVREKLKNQEEMNLRPVRTRIQVQGRKIPNKQVKRVKRVRKVRVKNKILKVMNSHPVRR